MRMLRFWDFLIKYVKFKQEHKEKHNFKQKHFREVSFQGNKKSEQSVMLNLNQLTNVSVSFLGFYRELC